MKKEKFLFCDVDETLIGIKSMLSFHDYWYHHWLPARGLENSEEHGDISAILRALARNGASRNELNLRYYEFFAGRRSADVRACAEQWFAATSGKPGFWRDACCDELRAMRARGYEPVLVSGSLTDLVQPIARALGVEHVLATRLVSRGEYYTGRIVPPQTIGLGKATAITMFLAQHDASGADCAAMGDDVSDIPMLEAVGHSIAVIGDPELSDEALLRGWRRIVVSPPMPA